MFTCLERRKHQVKNNKKRHFFAADILIGVQKTFGPHPLTLIRISMTKHQTKNYCLSIYITHTHTNTQSSTEKFSA